MSRPSVGDLIKIGSKDNIAPPPITNFKTEVGDGYVGLSWSNPDDTDFVGVKIQRKTGGYPVSEEDGTTAYDGVGTSFTDSGLVNETTYYYRAFTYDFDDNFQTDTGQQVSGVPTSDDDTSGSPGPRKLIGGDMSAGYFGRVPASDFITGDELASRIGLTLGISQYSNTDWLKFAIDGKIIFRPMKAIKYNSSWDDIDAANAVYGDKTIDINGFTYKVRLMKGAENDPYNDEDSDRDATGSEWNRLMLPIHENAPSSFAYPQFVDEPTEDWGINFSDADLLTHIDYGDGSQVWCQETLRSNSSDRVLRGGSGVSYSYWGTSVFSNPDRGWAPVLELV